MKFGPVTKLDKRNKTPSKDFDDDFMSANVTPLKILQNMANLEQSGSLILDA